LDPAEFLIGFCYQQLEEEPIDAFISHQLEIPPIITSKRFESPKIVP